MDETWTKQYSNTYKRHYWFNTKTNKTSWTDPYLNQLSTENKDESGVSTKRSRDNIITTESNEGNPLKKLDHKNDNNNDTKKLRHKVAIIVPFRDLHIEQNRKKHLDAFIPYMNNFLSQNTEIDYGIYIIQQSNDNRKFNRGKLLNIGYNLAKQDDCTIFIFHDVDLLPSSDLLSYYIKYPEFKPIHIAKRWNRYTKNAAYFGGIVSFTTSQFEGVNGFPNNFWGWGGEDDELYKRIVKEGLLIESPECGSIQDLEGMNIDTKVAFLKKHSLWKCMNKKEILEEHDNTWRINGISNMRHVYVLDTVCIPGTKEKSKVITVDIGLNDHWSDLVCHINDIQYDISTQELKEKYKQSGT